MPDTETELNSSEIAQDVQSELMDMIIADESPATISDKIKDMLFAKSADRQFIEARIAANVKNIFFMRWSMFVDKNK